MSDDAHRYWSLAAVLIAMVIAPAGCIAVGAIADRVTCGGNPSPASDGDQR